MSDFRARILQRLEQDYGINEDAVAEQLATVIKGQKVTSRLARQTSKDGVSTMVEVERTVTIAPADAARGLMLLDSLQGGTMGLTPRTVTVSDPAARMYGKWVPKVDSRVVHRKALPSVEELPDPTPVADEAPYDPAEVLSQIGETGDF